jgi:hypothetical protein
MEGPEEPRPEVPIESADDAVLRMLGGAEFGPNAKLILPSGRSLDAKEAQAFTAAFGQQASQEQATQADNPLSSKNDKGTGDEVQDRRNLVERAKNALADSQHQFEQRPGRSQPPAESHKQGSLARRALQALARAPSRIGQAKERVKRSFGIR